MWKLVEIWKESKIHAGECWKIIKTKTAIENSKN